MGDFDSTPYWIIVGALVSLIVIAVWTAWRSGDDKEDENED